MAFFEDVPPPPEFDPEPYVQPPWMAAPRDEAPVVVAVNERLAATDLAVLAVPSVSVFSMGLLIHVVVTERRGNRSRAEFQGRMHGHFPMAAPGALRFGVALADGTRAVTGSAARFDEQPTGPSLWTNGGGGGGDDQIQRMTHELWLWPLPPPGPVELVAEWRELGIEESSIWLDGAALIAAASGAQAIWPE
jgi:hypothetical protein